MAHDAGMLVAAGRADEIEALERPGDQGFWLLAELRVVRLVARGLTNRQIAERLYLSTYTVGTHLKHVFDKVGITSRVALTRLAVEHGLGRRPINP